MIGVSGLGIWLLRRCWIALGVYGLVDEGNGGSVGITERMQQEQVGNVLGHLGSGCSLGRNIQGYH